MFCTKRADPNGSELSVFKKSGDDFLPHSTVSFDENLARMAGAFINHDGKSYRPAQECNVQYGHAVSIQEVSKEGEIFSFKEVRRLFSVHPKYNIGMHTFNYNNNRIIVDSLGFHNNWIRKILKFFKVI